MKRFSRAIIVLFFIISLVSCSKQVVWPSSELGRTIPTIEGAKGEIHYNDPDSLYITLRKITKNQYEDFKELTDRAVERIPIRYTRKRFLKQYRYML